MRMNEPLSYIETESHKPFWVCSKHADVIEIERQNELFLNTQNSVLINKEIEAQRAAQGPGLRTLINMDTVEGRRGPRFVWQPAFRVVNTAFVAPDPDLKAVVDGYLTRLSEELAVEIGSTAVELDSRRSAVRGRETDCAFYVAERAESYYAARGEGAAAFVERTAPDLVVEAEITHFDEGKIDRYGEMGVRELWRLHGRKGSDELRVDFLALGAGSAPRELSASRVLEGLTPADVCEAVERVRFSRTVSERVEAVARIVRRRQRASVRVREEAESYSANSG